MGGNISASEARVGLFVDCDKVTPDIFEYALRMVTQFGRVVLHHGYGNQKCSPMSGRKH